MRSWFCVLVLSGFLWMPAALAVDADCQRILDRAEQWRQLREHDAATGVARATEDFDGLDNAARRACPTGAAQLLRARATNLTVLGQAEQALTDVDRGLAIIADSGVEAPAHLAALHLTAGVAHWELEAHDRAIGHYLQSLELSEQAGDIDGMARAAGNLGNLYNTLADFERAREFHGRAFAGFEQVGNQIGQAGTLINLAALDFRAAGQSLSEGNADQARLWQQSALNNARQALALFEGLGNPLGIAYAANNVASALEQLDRPEESLRYHQRALEIRRQVGDRLGVARSLNTMSAALIRLGRLDEAASLLEEAGEVIPADNLTLSEERAQRLVDLARARGEYADALAWQEEVTRLRGRMNENQVGLRVEEMRLAFESEQREQQLDRLRTDAMIRELELDRQRIASALALTAAVALFLLLVLMFRLYRQGQRMTRALELAASTDPLTGLNNRREMDRLLADLALSADGAPAKSAALMLIDADDFKRINDTLGHQQGDQVLVRLAEVLTAAIGHEGRVARWGGEEFLVLLPDCDLVRGEAMAERLRRAVSQADIVAGGNKVTVTIGLTLFDRSESATAALSRADAALYRGKMAGKNRVVVEETEHAA